MNLLDSNTLEAFTGIFGDHFDTFSSFRSPIIVNKEPIKTYSVVDQPNFGYGPVENTITYTPVSGSFAAIIIYPKSQDKKFFGETRSYIPQGDVAIKVKPEAKNFIESGKTENIVVNGVTYNNISDFRIQDYYGLQFYYYDLKRLE